MRAAFIRVCSVEVVLYGRDMLSDDTNNQIFLFVQKYIKTNSDLRHYK